ncbi:MAG: divergent polysaccharide deacetylase family protein [Alphaproteobacteria bacterium]
MLIPQDQASVVERPAGLNMRDSVAPAEAPPAMAKPKAPPGNGATAQPKEARTPAPGKLRIINPNRRSGPTGEPVKVVLARAPVADLVERTEFGALPRIAADGRKPAQVYARPLSPTGADRTMVQVAVLIGGMGISTSGTSAAIKTLAPAVTLAFAPYGGNLQSWVDRARSQGHEVMLQIPMEPFDYPDNDPGPHTLLTTLKDKENLTRLNWLLGRFTGYTGITNYMGAKFTATEAALKPIMAQVTARGLSYFDDGASPRSRAATLAQAAQTTFIRGNVLLDVEQSSAAIDKALLKLETVAKERGFAIGVGTALPVTIQRVAQWAKGLRQRGIALVPVSAIFETEQR